MRMVVGQIPLQALRVVVEDDPGKPVDMHTYQSVALRLVNPDGQVVDTSAGVTTVDSAGAVLYSWPLTTLFPKPGDYHFSIIATKPGVQDVTSATIVEVYREPESRP